MFTQRHTAYKVNVKDLVTSEYVQVPGESDYLKFNDLRLSRARVIATIVNKSVYDEKKSGFLVIDDGTETIRVRGWEDQYDIIDKANIGDLVEVIGRIRRYNEEVYLIPEVIKKVNANWFLLRKLELKKDKLRSEPIEFKEAQSIDETAQSSNGFSKDKMYDLIKKNDKGQGAELASLVNGSMLGREECLKVIRELMGEGLVFEPKPNKFKVLD